MEISNLVYHKPDSWWDVIRLFAVFSVFIVLISAFSLYVFSSKEFRGYYLHDTSSEYTIMIDWDNAPDQKVFSTKDARENLRVFKELTK